MKRSTLLLSLALGITAVGTSACLPPPPMGAVVVERRPPADRVEVIGVAPTPGYVWIAGYWGWEGGRRDYVWVPGRWSAVERGRRGWVPGRWRHGRGGWFWIDGHWR